MKDDKLRLTCEFDDEFKKRLINAIERSIKNQPNAKEDAAILFHWVRHQDDPAYSFVPKKYRRK